MRIRDWSSDVCSSDLVGITLIGVLTGAYSGASLGQPVADRLSAWLGLDAENAEAAGFATVIALTTYVSLIAGELVPKQFAPRARTHRDLHGCADGLAVEDRRTARLAARQ